MNYTLEIGSDGNLYVVFEDEYQAFEAYYLFGDLLGMRCYCFDGYYNSWSY